MHSLDRHNTEPDCALVADAARAALVRRLTEDGLIAPAAIDRAEKLAAASGQPLAVVLTQLGLVSERDLTEALSAVCGLPLVTAADFPTAAVCDDILNRQFLRAMRVVPLRESDDGLSLAMLDPLAEDAVAGVRFAVGKPVLRRVAYPADLEAAFERLYGKSEPDSVGGGVAAVHDEGTIEDVDRLRDLASEAPVIRLVNQLIARAVEARASDIHVESVDGGLRVRCRVDGALQDLDAPPPHLRAAIVSRLKIMAKLNIAERRLPQDGRLRQAVQGRDVDFRVSTTPTLHGESVVLRILDRSQVTLDFAALGFDAGLLAAFRGMLGQPYGMVLVTGPTSSGKTTTLYGALMALNRPDKKILTVEDPIEYQLPGINQVQVKPQIGLTFANALRSFLRQNPNIIMVGEIRDLETAEIAVQAALTGHLILSTLHTNDAASAITRLLDMGVADFLLTSTVSGVVAQRLVRTLCPECRAPAQPDQEMRDIPYRPVGCGACGGTGYRGRTAIIEALTVTETIRRLIRDRADETAVRQAAVAEGMRTMRRHGMEKVRAGLTTLDEVLGATQDV